MKIAIVAPSPTPFTIGGAENLYWGLQRFINEQTPHQCELIKVVSPESDLLSLLDSYLRFSILDLSHFDCVISTKYPSWMVSHTHHVCYILHRLRGLYDTYHFLNLPEEPDWRDPKLAPLLSLRDRLLKAEHHPQGNNLSEIAKDCLDTFKGLRNPDLLQFPSPISRWIIHTLDRIALSPDRVKRYTAISENVKQREDYFPTGVDVSVLYPPPIIENFRCGSFDYLFTVSRLDGPKRLDLLIEAMKHVKSNIPLLIAGTGPEEKNLKALASNDSRIKFIGFVNDEDLIDYYANALAVPFVPFDEDYGLITIEAMRSGKPVLTCLDSGGSNEFVRNDLTGYSVPPLPEALAEKIDLLANDIELAKTLGKRARKAVSGVRWASVVDGLLQDSSVTHRVAKEKKIVVAVTFPVFPPRGGGQSRVFHLYRHLARYYDIEIVSLCGPEESGFSGEIAPGLHETRIPMSSQHQMAEAGISRTVGYVPVTDIVMEQLIHLTPEYQSALRRACANAAIVIASHPYLGMSIADCAPQAEFWLEAHNVEYLLKKAMLPDTDEGQSLVKTTFEIESFCWKRAHRIFACAQADIDVMEKLYGQSVAPKHEVPNGVAIEEIDFIEPRIRRERREKLALDEKFVALFMGSWHGPNIEAAGYVLEFARQLPDVMFLLVGSVCAALQAESRPIPENVALMGVVDEAVKAVLLGTADIALNPMTSGSGSNLKMLDYFAAGIPVISTPFGARGIEVKRSVHFYESELENFSSKIMACTTANSTRIVKRARALAEGEYAWQRISEKFYATLNTNVA